jgi:adenine-specific DNA-methyltransferase
MTVCIDPFSDYPEKHYMEYGNKSTRNKYAQFFTPFSIAKFMSKWVLNNRKNIKILDPAVGLGILLRASYLQENKIELIGYDVEENILKNSQELFSKNNISIDIANKDYLLNDWNNKYDGIICNPPYLKFQNFKNKDESIKEMKKKLNISLNGLSNIYSLFIIKSIHQLNKNGRIAYIVPYEFLNADYGENVKKIILKNKLLKYILIFNSELKIFDNVLTTTCILLFENTKNEDVSFINIDTVEELNNFELIFDLKNNSEKIKTYKFSELDYKKKWRTYYRKQHGYDESKLVSFSTYAKVVRGIATGANEYFTFNKTKQKENNISSNNLIPCITKAKQIKTNFFTEADYQILYKNDDKIMLFDGKTITNKASKQYIKIGEELNIHTKYLTSKRKPWYSLENRLLAPILVGVFNRKGLKFIRNETNAKNLTSFHCVYPNILLDNKINLFFAYLLTDVAKNIFNSNKREYGGGLEKFEPNDLNKSKVINLDIIETRIEKNILENYEKYRKSVLNKKENKKYLREINNIFLHLLEV